MKRVLVTGATGFVGSHMCELLASKDLDVYGTAYGDHQLGLNFMDPEKILSLNLLNSNDVGDVVKKVDPNWVIHLAALSSPKASFSDAGLTVTNNVAAELNLLESLREYAPNIEKILVISSAEIYGKVDEANVPVSEDTPLRPTSPYAVSKIAQDYLGLQYFLSYSLPVVRLRPFNHTGERRPPVFVLPAFAEQVAKIEVKQQEPAMKVGNLDAIRDFCDVKDMTKAYLLALEKCIPGEEYNIGTGVGVKIENLLMMLLKLSTKTIKVEVDETKMKPADVPILIADCQKFTGLTGWKPEIPLGDTVERVLNYWRDQVKK